MLIKDLLEGSMENNLIDLQALIMFLVFEKEVLKMDDDATELDLYYKENNRRRMNQELAIYKNKMNMKYGLYAYQIKSTEGVYYISAYNEPEAVYIAYQNGITTLEIKMHDEDQVMEFNGTHITLKSIMDKPKLLGGNKHE